MSSTKQQQVLVLEPSGELTFRGPFTEYVTSNLHLTNPTAKSIFFKVKTTAPRFYCVRPNSGLIKPKDSTLVNVMLQPVEQISTLENERSRHKFMIQTAYAPDDWSESGGVSPDQFWKGVDTSSVMDSKLRVVFQRPDGEVIDSPTTTQRTHSGSESGHHHSQVQQPQSQSQSVHDAGPGHKDETALQKEVELRKMYQDEKKNLERENYILMEKLDKLSRSAGTFGTGGTLSSEGLPTLHVVLIALFALLVGIIIGKLF